MVPFVFVSFKSGIMDCKMYSAAQYLHGSRKGNFGARYVARLYCTFSVMVVL